MALIGGEGLWCGASLRPWQILHSRLAEMHTCGHLELDVWELIDETVEAAYNPSEYKKEELHFLDGDDGELWRHGGLMEAKIRDWLKSKLEEEEEVEEEEEGSSMNMHTYYLEYNSSSASTFSSEFNRSATAPIFSSEFSEACREYSRLEEDNVYIEEDEVDPRDSNIAGAAIFAAPLDTETHYDQFSDDLQRCTNEEDDDHEQLCAVCLEKLFDNEELQELMISTITRLRCRHSFHSPCLAPWLSASSFCPCCRAPIALLFSPDLEAPPDLGHSSACSDRVQWDMMGLLAEMEAALDRFGLLS